MLLFYCLNSNFIRLVTVKYFQMTSSLVQHQSNLIKTEAQEVVDDSGIKSDGEIRS